jgi:hypothetical protein
MPDAPKPKRRWYQFSLRTLLIFVTLSACACSWFAVKMQQARKQRQAVQAIKKLGGTVRYDYELNVAAPNPTPPGPVWLRKCLGADFVANVAEVIFSGAQITDADLEQLQDLAKLQQLLLSDTQVTDAGLEHLEQLNHLMYLDLTRTKVTDVGVRRLRQALPYCYIVQWTCVAGISGNDQITNVHIPNLLASKRIECMLEGSMVNGVSVPKQHVAETKRLLLADAKKRGYSINFDEIVRQEAVKTPPKQIGSPVAEALTRPEFAKDKPLGRFLRGANLSAKVRAYPYLASMAVREREYLATTDRMELGYEVEIVLHQKAGDDSIGFRGRYQILANGQKIESLGSNEWGNSKSSPK